MFDFSNLLSKQDVLDAQHALDTLRSMTSNNGGIPVSWNDWKTKTRFGYARFRNSQAQLMVFGEVRKVRRGERDGKPTYGYVPADLDAEAER